MNTFVPEGADYYKGAMALDLPRLRKQLVEVQQIHLALTSGGPAHILHHPATQMWLGHENALLRYGSMVYWAYLDSTGRTHKSGEYIDKYLQGDSAKPDWIEHLAPMHRAKLFFKDNTHYAQYRDGAVDDRPRYPVTRDGKTICWAARYGGRWYLVNGPEEEPHFLRIATGGFRSTWTAIQWARELLV